MPALVTTTPYQGAATDPNGLLNMRNQQYLNSLLSGSDRASLMAGMGAQPGDMNAAQRSALQATSQYAEANPGLGTSAYLAYANGQFAAPGSAAAGSAGSAGSSSSTGMDPNDPWSYWTKLYEDYNKAQQGRYDEILKDYQDRYTRNLDTLKAVGQQNEADINRQYDNLLAQQTGRLIDRGWGDSTIADSLHRGVAEERTAAISRNASDIAARQIDLDQALSGQTAAFKERLDINLPGYQLLSQLASQLGAGGVGYLDGSAADNVSQIYNGVPVYSGADGVSATPQYNVPNLTPAAFYGNAGQQGGQAGVNPAQVAQNIVGQAGGGNQNPNAMVAPAAGNAPLTQQEQIKFNSEMNRLGQGKVNALLKLWNKSTVANQQFLLDQWKQGNVNWDTLISSGGTRVS